MCTAHSQRLATCMQDRSSVEVAVFCKATGGIKGRFRWRIKTRTIMLNMKYYDSAGWKLTWCTSACTGTPVGREQLLSSNLGFLFFFEYSLKSSTTYRHYSYPNAYHKNLSQAIDILHSATNNIQHGMPTTYRYLWEYVTVAH